MFSYEHILNIVNGTICSCDMVNSSTYTGGGLDIELKVYNVHEAQHQ